MANTKITTGADATIVAAATRAGLAAAPPDYSDTFENVSKSYAETVKSSEDMWKEIINATAIIGGELVKNAADWNSTVQKVYDAGGTENVVNEIYALKDELRGLGPLSGIFGNRETRKKRMEILTRKNQLFSEIDQWGEVINNAAIAIENNNLDYNLMGLDKESALNAIIASNTNNKITVTNEYARITKNEQGGLSYTVYNEDGSEATYLDGSPKTMSLSEFKSLISQNVADKENVYGNSMNELSTSAENLGVTYGGEYTEYHSGKMRGALNNMTNTANDRRRLMRTAFGIDNKSFFDDITKGPSELQADMWTLMMKNLAAGEIKGELAVTTGQRGELLTNIKDTDNSKGISQEEINEQWAGFTSSLLSGESDFSKQAIIDYADKKFKLNFEFGARQKALGKDASGKESDSTGFLNTKKSVYANTFKRYMNYNDAKALYDAIKLSTENKEATTNIDGVRYDYDIENNNWYTGEGEDKIDYGNPEAFIKNIGINDPDFAALIKQQEVSSDEGSGNPMEIQRESDAEYRGVNMRNEEIEGGVLANLFMLDDDEAEIRLKAMFPPGFTFKKAGTVSKFFGRDKITIIAPDGTNLGTYEFGYGANESEEALEQSKMFNSNIVQGNYFRRKNLKLGI